jgi:hypothetical protein
MMKLSTFSRFCSHQRGLELRIYHSAVPYEFYVILLHDLCCLKIIRCVSVLLTMTSDKRQLGKISNTNLAPMLGGE